MSRLSLINTASVFRKRKLRGWQPRSMTDKSPVGCRARMRGAIEMSVSVKSSTEASRPMKRDNSTEAHVDALVQLNGTQSAQPALREKLRNVQSPALLVATLLGFPFSSLYAPSEFSISFAFFMLPGFPISLYTRLFTLLLLSPQYVVIIIIHAAIYKNAQLYHL